MSLIDPRHFKRPESVLVVVHTATEVLLLKRADHDNFWQSVTGSLHWGETAQAAALRELQEETGLVDRRLRATGIRRGFKILDVWRPRYHPDAADNYETLFYCPLERRASIALSEQEHSEYQWVPFEPAMSQVYSWTNRLGIASLL